MRGQPSKAPGINLVSDFSMQKNHVVQSRNTRRNKRIYKNRRIFTPSRMPGKNGKAPISIPFPNNAVNALS